MVQLAFESGDVKLAEVSETAEGHSDEQHLKVASDTTSGRLSNLNTRKDHFLLSLFAVSNLLIFKLLLLLPFFAQVEEGLKIAFTSIVALLGTFISVLMLPELFKLAWSGLKARRLRIELNLSLGITALLGGILFGAISDFSVLVESSLASVLVGTLFLVSIWRYLELAYLSRVFKCTAFSLDHLAPRVRLANADSKTKNEDSDKEQHRNERFKEISEVRRGDIISVREGEYLPCDATVISGRCEIRERRYGGFELVSFKSPGQEVFAGSGVVAGEISCRVNNIYKDSRITSFTAPLLNQFGSVKVDSQQSERYSFYLNALVLVGAIAFLFYARGMAMDPLQALSITSALLVISILSSLVNFASPLKRLLLSSSFLKGALFKNPGVIDRLAGVRTFVVDYLNSSDNSLGVRISNFEVIDDRVERDNLVSALLALLGSSSTSADIAATQHLRGKVKNLELFEVKDFRRYPDKGISGVINGVDFSIGSEAFLIERGVELQQSEVEREEGSDSSWVYAAINTEVVAKYRVTHEVLEDGADFVAGLKRLGIRPLLCSQAKDSEQIDRAGKELGLELANINSALSKEDYLERLNVLEEPALLGSVKTDPALFSAASVSFATFDELRWNLGEADVTLFSAKSALITEVIDLVRCHNLLKRSGAVVITTLALLLFGLVLTSSLNAVGVLMISLLAALLLMLFSFRLLPSNPF